MNSASLWRRHATATAAVRVQLFPGSVPLAPNIGTCPLHGGRVGSVTRMCLRCHSEGWEHTAATFVDRGA